MKYFLLAFMLFFSFFVQARGITMGAALDYRFERGMDQNISPGNYLNVFGAYRFDPFSVGVEFFQKSADESKAGTVSVWSRKSGLLLNGSVTSYQTKNLSFYLAAGFGFSKQWVQTTLSDQKDLDSSRWYMMGYGGLGLRLNLLTSFYTAIEGRLYLAENQDPEVVWAPLLKAGFEF